MKKILSITVVVLACMGLAISCTPNPARVGAGDTAVRPAETSETKEVKAKPEKQKKQKKKAAVKQAETSPEIVEEEQLAFAKPEQVTFEYERIVPVDPSLDPGDFFPPEEKRPEYGGTARLYLQREFLDDAVSDIVRINPFGSIGEEGGEFDGESDDKGGELPIFKVTDSTHRRLELTLTEEVRRANGRKVTALDFVELWSRFMKARPAQGLALFRNVQGAEGFVTGKDPLVGGFNAADEFTIRMRFAGPDPLAFARLNSSKLIGGPFMLGTYYTGATKGSELLLLPNPNSRTGDPAFLREFVVVTGGDPNPLKTFAAGGYDAMTLYAAYDLQIARTELADDNASLRKLHSDRYFISCISEDENVRKFVRKSANGADLVSNVVGAEGEEIGCVSAHCETVLFPRGNVAAPQFAKPIRFIYRGDDPISVKVAQKITDDLTAAGMAAEAIGLNAEKYEAALVRKQYDCALGWVPETVLESQTEQLHLASMWFSDETDHDARVRGYKEIPLFSVNNYLLLRDDARLYQDKLSGLWVDTSQDGEE